MGVSGAGKTTVGLALADRLGFRYVEADDLHPPRNRAMLAQGRPLSDQDRFPWLRAVGERLAAPGVVVACSALERTYRNVLKAHAPDLVTVHLALPPEVAAQRLAEREDHFASPTLLDSQFATLEPLAPEERGLTVDAAQPVTSVLDGIEAALARGLEPSSGVDAL
ncbi:MAG TPA: gluconokinase [Acidimicrobiales bacterium]|nr:MAG: hypothetical protein B7Z69_05085 [Actinobacteria bacterium 21-73-9]HQU27253.1 gluconokinase [Acidimicrobiales bacterium]